MHRSNWFKVSALVLLLVLIAWGLALCTTSSVAAEPIVGHYPGGSPADRIAASDAVRDQLEPVGVRLGYLGDFLDLEAPGTLAVAHASVRVAWDSGAVYVLNLMTAQPLHPLAWPTSAADWQRWQPYYALARVIRDWGEACGPRCYLVLVPWPEHDGGWVPYGQTPDDFREAFGRLRYVLWYAGALPYTRMLWGPSADTAKRLAPYYPGAWADLVGCSAYHEVTAGPTSVRACVESLRTVAPGTPILIAQTGACAPGNGAWTRSLVRYLLEQPDVLGALIFEYDKECDWRLRDGWREAVRDLDPRVRR